MPLLVPVFLATAPKLDMLCKQNIHTFISFILLKDSFQSLSTEGEQKLLPSSIKSIKTSKTYVNAMLNLCFYANSRYAKASV